MNIIGRVRYIKTDALKYPDYKSVEKAINKNDCYISDWKKNIVPTVGLVGFANGMSENSGITNPGLITYGAIGHGTATPLIIDTALDNEYVRTAISIKYNTANVLYVRQFYSASMLGGFDVQEIGLFGEDASAVVVGTMFERALLYIDVSDGKNVTIESSFTIS